MKYFSNVRSASGRTGFVILQPACLSFLPACLSVLSTSMSVLPFPSCLFFLLASQFLANHENTGGYRDMIELFRSAKHSLEKSSV